MKVNDVNDHDRNTYFIILAQRTGYEANWNQKRGWEFEKKDIHVWACSKGWAKAKLVKGNYRDHQYFKTVEEALVMSISRNLDTIDYHDIVKIVEKYRPYSVKMIQTEEMRILEPVLNNIRYELRELRKTKKKGI
jgi:hypothetical protein